MRKLIKVTVSASISAIVVSTIASSNGQEEKWVASKPSSRMREDIEMSDASTDNMVRIIHSDAGSAPSELKPRAVITIGYPSQFNDSIRGSQSMESEEPGFRADASWPNTKGRISSIALTKPKTSIGGPIRNPWEVRRTEKAIVKEIVLDCGGIIIGSKKGPVAILNGGIFRRGDSLGNFRIAEILKYGVMLERNGSYIVIPRGRPTTVEIVED